MTFVSRRKAKLATSHPMRACARPIPCPQGTDRPATLHPLPGDNSAVAPPDPIPNSEVKRSRADGSVHPHARVGHRQGLTPNPAGYSRRGFSLRQGNDAWARKLCHGCPQACHRATLWLVATGARELVPLTPLTGNPAKSPPTAPATSIDLSASARSGAAPHPATPATAAFARPRSAATPPR